MSHAADDDIEAFFDRVARFGYEPRLERTSGTMRFEIFDDQRADQETDHWLVTFSRGHLDASRGQHPADTVIRIDRATFRDLITGRANMVENWLRNRVQAFGAPTLLFQFWLIPGLFPGPPDADHPRDFVRRARR
ncbi:SCP-2 sterol transfer family protein [Micromonospora pisi]|uniref:SCP-2 sterol transfer family protein n=1 Tax=Micromonospora pisi TaxID=589240 RepID=A0A495JSI9_9ACTN|nr:SCP2 sterol-binding domain-containing protein [Micromonospora pisi]RKR91821.1 SCP-2 sterol transfer family protein [Micromonospora pisi]